ncbi:hypothetical protein EUGRSUZ_E02131 [Eucalyptus grandis]|uniref:Uncharacterized protein n=2 Tax=Eucalyptus grandis TaxID=71139 RepID=A0ACC3KW22_EUCGR|nr:hypothetical protein EUGRSUZ_E02131 [Eucalyptus grandis]
MKELHNALRLQYWLVVDYVLFWRVWISSAQQVQFKPRTGQSHPDQVWLQIKPPPTSPVDRFTQVLAVGIGGSALGPQFVAKALAPDNPPLEIRIIDNTDLARIDHQIAQLGPEMASTLVIVILKSGGTPETRDGLLEVHKAFHDVGLEFAKQILH